MKNHVSKEKLKKKTFVSFFSAYRPSVSLYSGIGATNPSECFDDQETIGQILFLLFLQNPIELEKHVSVFFNTSFFWSEGLSVKACCRFFSRKLLGKHLFLPHSNECLLVCTKRLEVLQVSKL